MLETLAGSVASTRITRPRIWLLSTWVDTALAMIRVLAACASQPSASRAAVPTITSMTPRLNSPVTACTAPWRNASVTFIST